MKNLLNYMGSGNDNSENKEIMFISKIKGESCRAVSYMRSEPDL